MSCLNGQHGVVRHASVLLGSQQPALSPHERRGRCRRCHCRGKHCDIYDVCKVFNALRDGALVLLCMWSIDGQDVVGIALGQKNSRIAETK